MKAWLLRIYHRFWENEKFRLWFILIFAFCIRFLSILPHGNGIVIPYRDQNTYYSYARALVDDGYLGVPKEPRGPYLEDRAIRQHPPGFYPSFHDSIAAIWDKEGYLYGMMPWGKPNTMFEPLYPLLAAGMYMVFGDNFFYWRLIHVLIGTLLVYFVYDIGKRAFKNHHIGTWAALYTSVYPHFLFYSWILMSEPLLITTLSGGFWAYFRLLEKPHWKWAALLGAFFGAFFLTRSFIIAFFPVMVICVLIFCRNRQRWILAFITVFSFTLVLSPWIYRNYKLNHQLVVMSTRGGFNLWLRNNPYFIEDEWKAMGVVFSPEELSKLKYREYILGFPTFSPDQSETERNEILTHEGVKFIRENPGFYMKLCWIRFKWVIGYKGIGLKGPLMNGISLLSYGPVLLGFLISLFWGWRYLAASLPMWSVVGYFVLFYSLTHDGMRYRLPVDSFIILMAAFSSWIIYQKIITKSCVTVGSEYVGIKT